jgi:hypothetical protein
LALVCGVLFALAVRPPEAFASAQVGSVSCAAPGDCTAVGSYDAGQGGGGLLLTETGGVWAPGMEAPLPANTRPYPGGSGLGSVSCVSAGYCSAIGDGLFGHHEPHDGLLLSETAGAWATHVASPAGSVWDLDSVSCGSPGDCSAVGSFIDDSSHSQGLLLSESGGVWAPGVEAPLPANAGGAFFSDGVGPSSVSCASAGNCSAVGYFVDTSNHAQGLLLSETGGVWAPGVEATLPANASTSPNVGLGSVSCTSAGNCSAVGAYDDSSNHQQGLLLTETNGVWAPGIEATPPANAAATGLGSVSCASAGNCSAVGYYRDSSGSEHGVLLTETNGVWAPGVEATLPANAAATNGYLGLGSVSCASAGNCSAVGYYLDSAGGQQGLLLTETNGVWAPGVEATLPANASSRPNVGVRLGSVSCAAVGECAAVGSYLDSSGVTQGLLLTETGSIWAPGVEATVPANVVPALSGLRVSPKTFVLVGRRADGRCVRQTGSNHTHRRCTRPIKLTVGYTLNTAATVTLTFKRLAPGRKVDGRCVKPTNTNSGRRRCARLIRVPGQITVPWLAGANSITFRGRVGGKTLGPGSYRLTATPETTHQSGTARTAAFKIEP